MPKRKSSKKAPPAPQLWKNETPLNLEGYIYRNSLRVPILYMSAELNEKINPTDHRIIVSGLNFSHLTDTDTEPNKKTTLHELGRLIEKHYGSKHDKDIELIWKTLIKT